MPRTRYVLFGGPKHGDEVILCEPAPERLRIRYALPIQYRFYSEDGWQDRQFVHLDYRLVGNTYTFMKD